MTWEPLKKVSFLGTELSMFGEAKPEGARAGRRPSRRISRIFSPSPLRQTDNARCSDRLADASRQTGDRGEDEKPAHRLATAMTGLAQRPDPLHPAEWLIDPITAVHGGPDAGMADRSSIDRGAGQGNSLSSRASASMVIVVAANGVWPGTVGGRAVGLGQAGIEPVAETPDVAITARAMRVSLWLFAMEVARGGASVGLVISRSGGPNAALPGRTRVMPAQASTTQASTTQASTSQASTSQASTSQASTILAFMASFDGSEVFLTEVILFTEELSVLSKIKGLNAISTGGGHAPL